jgi:hypothetical protein
MSLATGEARHADGSYVRLKDGQTRLAEGPAISGVSAGHREAGTPEPGATPYNSHPDLWQLTMGEKLPNTSPGLKRQRHARLCGLKNPSAGAKAHWEFTERDAWPEYTPESSAPPARRWTGVSVDGYQESSEPLGVRRRGWQMGVQAATMTRASDCGVTRRHGSGSTWLQQQTWNERTRMQDVYTTSRMAPTSQLVRRVGSADMWRGRSGIGEPFRPAEWRAVGLAGEWAERPADGWKWNPTKLLTSYGTRGAKVTKPGTQAMRARRAAGADRWHHQQHQVTGNMAALVAPGRGTW